MQLTDFLWIIFLTLLPGLELRLSIPAGILTNTIDLPFLGTFSGMGLPIEAVFFTAVLTNMILGPVVFFMLEHFLNFFLQFKWLKKFYDMEVKAAQKKVFPLVEKYGIIGIAFFVAIPLPGSGSYTGALAAHLLGMGEKKFAIANAIGVTIAGILVTAITIGFVVLS